MRNKATPVVYDKDGCFVEADYIREGNKYDTFLQVGKLSKPQANHNFNLTWPKLKLENAQNFEAPFLHPPKIFWTIWNLEKQQIFYNPPPLRLELGKIKNVDNFDPPLT